MASTLHERTNMSTRVELFSTLAIEAMTSVVGGQASSCDDAGGPLCSRTLDVNGIEKRFRAVNPAAFSSTGPQSIVKEE